MIDKIRKGNRVAGLLYYLYGPGKSDEHRDPHLVAGWRPPAEVEPPFRADGRRDFRDLVNQLNAPLDAVDRKGARDSVWHCVLSAAPEDPLLSDEQWDQIAAGFMDRMGLAPRDDPAGVRWVAVRHGLSRDGIDHVHIVATLARQDGALPSIHNDFIRARKACRAIEEEFGLRATAAADCTAAPRPSRAETEQARRTGRSEPPRITLRRIVQDAAATAVSEEDFFARVRDNGAVIRTRNSATADGAIGYAVALPAKAAGTRRTVWFSGGKLAPDLTLPKLRHRWKHPADPACAIPPTGKNLDARSVRAFLRSAARSAAERARNETGFFRLLDDAGILIRHRYSEINPGEITGYALTLPGHADEHGDLHWYGGGRLAEHLALPRLRKRWDSPAPPGRLPASLSPAERHALWADIIRLTGDGAAGLRRLATADPAAAADAAWATADALRSAAQAIGGTPGRQVRRAAGRFDRAARQTYRTIPSPTPAGNGLRTASRLLGVLRGSGSHGVRVDQLIVSLIQLAEETARLRLAQTHAHQATAARETAQQLISLQRDPALRSQLPDRETARMPAAARPANDIARADIPAAIRLRPPTPAPAQPRAPEKPQVPQPAHSPLKPTTHGEKPQGPAP